MRAEEFMSYLDQDEINRIADAIRADIKIYSIGNNNHADYNLDWIMIDIQFLGLYSHTSVMINEFDCISKDVMNDNIKRLIFSKLLDIYRKYLSDAFNFSE